MLKLTFDEVLERLADERSVKSSEVLAKDLNRKLWINEWHIPGCLSESFGYNLTKHDAIESACQCAETENGTPWGMKTNLSKFGRFDCETDTYGYVINTIYKTNLSNILG